MMIQNPVIRGFNPDPTMCYANGYFYVATSTFQWYPGVTIYRSKDLNNFEIVSQPLTEELNFNLLGIDDSAGIWAPNLVYTNGMFYLSYTIVKSATGVYYDMENYITTASKISGPWTMPVQINSGCFDPSLFFEDDRLYMFGKIVDHRYEPNNDYIEDYSGIILQELDKNTFALIGDYKVITHGTKLGGEEGPQMFKRNGYYYLNIAEGGTEYGHQTTVLRSEKIDGPFEVHPHNPVLKSQSRTPLQKAGHSSFVKYGDDKWVISHLCARPISSTVDEIVEKKCCPLGRETAIQKVVWVDDWPYLWEGREPLTNFQLDLDEEKYESNDNEIIKLFDNKELLSLRQDISRFNIVDNDALIMQGKDSLMSKFDVNLIGYRPKELAFKTSIDIEFEAESYLQMSGLTLYYDTENYLTVFITHDEKFGKCIKVEALKHRKYSTLNVTPIPVASDVINLEFEVVEDQIKVNYKIGDEKTTIPCQYNASLLSDDYILLDKPSFFTGMMIGIYCSDLTGKGLKNRVFQFKYK